MNTLVKPNRRARWVSAASVGAVLLVPLLISAQEETNRDTEKKESRILPGGKDLEGRDVDIVEGEIPVKEFLKFLADYTGQPVITGAPPALLANGIPVVSSIANADGEIVKAILTVNGWQLSEKRLPDGRVVLVATFSSDSSLKIAPEKAPSTASHAVLRREGEAFSRVESSEPSLVTEGVGPEDTVSVVTTLEHLDLQSATQTLQGIFPQGGAPGQQRQLRATPVPDMDRLILTGSPHVVDYALKLLKAIDVDSQDERENPEIAIDIIELESADPDQMVQLLSDLLPSDGTSTRFVRRSTVPRTLARRTITTRGSTSSGTRIYRDQRTRKIIVRTSHLEDIETVRALVKEFDVVPSREKTPELQIRVLPVKHASVETVARVVQEMLSSSSVPRPTTPARVVSPSTVARIVTYQETNSLVIKATAEEIAEIEKLLHLIDAPVPDPGTKAPGAAAPPTAPGTTPAPASSTSRARER